MNHTNPMLLIDFYKAVHAEMLPEKITKSVSYFTPRMSRINMWQKVVHFGLQGFCKTYLINYFNNYFFSLPLNDVIEDYRRIMDATLGKDVYKIEKIKKLRKLGYLPIEIFSLPEGTLVPMHIPTFGITNTHPDFAWLPQSLESLISAEMWHPMIAATVGHTYREIVNKYYELTCDDNVARADRLLQRLRQWQALNDKPIDWDDAQPEKFYVSYDYRSEKLTVDYMYNYRDLFGIYFTSREKVNEAIEVFGKDLTWYFTEYKQRLDRKGGESHDISQ